MVSRRTGISARPEFVGMVTVAMLTPADTEPVTVATLGLCRGRATLPIREP